MYERSHYVEGTEDCMIGLGWLGAQGQAWQLIDQDCAAGNVASTRMSNT